MPRFYLTKVECEVLWRKYVKGGFNSFEANEKLEKTKSFLKGLVLKLRKKNKSDEEIEKKFQRAFELLCQKLEV